MSDATTVTYTVHDAESEWKYLLRTNRDALDLNNVELETPRINGVWANHSPASSEEAIPRIFAVTDDWYLHPVTSRHRLANALSLSDFEQLVPADDLLYFGLWELIALQLMSDSHTVASKKLDESEWNRRWGYIAGGDILTAAIREYLDNGDLSRTQKLRVLEIVRNKRHDKPELAKNLLLRVCGALARNRMSAVTAIFTLLSEDFRRSVSNHEISQLKMIKEAMALSSGPFAAINADELSQIDIVLRILEQDPISSDKVESSVQADCPPAVDGFSLFLQAAN